MSEEIKISHVIFDMDGLLLGILLFFSIFLTLLIDKFI